MNLFISISNIKRKFECEEIDSATFTNNYNLSSSLIVVSQPEIVLN